jgi:hypothetical protein
MECRLQQLDAARVIPYLVEAMEAIELYPAMLARIISGGNDGVFYALTPPELGETDVYDLEGGWKFDGLRVFVEPNVARVFNVYSDWLPQLIREFLNSKQRFLLLEDLNSSPDYVYVKDRPKEFFVHDDHLVYIENEGCDIEKIRTHLIYAQAWIYTGVFTDFTGRDFEPEQDYQDVGLISQHVEAFFFEIYDGESLLFWFRHPKHELIEKLRSLSNAIT